MSHYLHLPCENTEALRNHQVRQNRLQAGAAAHAQRVDARALELASTYSDDAALVEKLEDLYGNHDGFTAAMRTLFEGVLLSGNPRIPAEMIEIIEGVAKDHFHDMAVRDIALEDDQ